MALIGYARVSTDNQNLDHQVEELKAAGCIKIFTEKYTGASMDRPVFNQCLEYMREGDVLVVTNTDRIGRSLIDSSTIITQELPKRKIHFKSLTEPFDTTSAWGEMVFHILGAVAEAQRKTLIERTRAGLKAAKARGMYGGRKYKLNSEQVQKMLELYVANIYTHRKLCRLFGISKSSLLRYIERAKLTGTYPKNDTLGIT